MAINDKNKFDVIVIGAGHAGIEAACASARMGVKTILITKKLDNLGEMSCNPAIGGVAKGTIVKEIDALDGVMGKAIDMAGIHFRILNSSKGPAVHSPRAQADRNLYKKAIRKILKQDYGVEINNDLSVNSSQNLDIIFDSVEDLIIENKKINGVILENNNDIYAESVILTAGTFLNGIIHIGDKKIKAGRVGEKPSYGISEKLQQFDFNISRLKTGTPPRILKKSINFDELEKQPSDEKPTPFSYLNSKVEANQTSCFITYTNQETHKIIRDNLDKSAMYGGEIASKGPRYCPSIEDKIHRFYDKERHQIFLEPEGLEPENIENLTTQIYNSESSDNSAIMDKKNYQPYELVYPNGISTSLPVEVQEKFIKTIKGLENCVVTQAGYAIEYDFIDPRELLPTLETKKITNLFFAGQINGTTGYEEAGGQGIIAGINAALKSLGKEEKFILDRSTSYIGVMIDDLTILGTTEPYRMLTSRAEYRLSLRADNADLRLTEHGINIGCVLSDRKQKFLAKKQKIVEAINILGQLKISPKKLEEKSLKIKQDGVVRTAFELLGFANINPLAKNNFSDFLKQNNSYFGHLSQIWPDEISQIELDIQKQVAIEGLYAPYLKRQEEDIKILKKDSNIKIPLDLDYNKIQSLSLEVREKLSQIKPENIAAALRIQGITPAAAMAIMVYLKKIN